MPYERRAAERKTVVAGLMGVIMAVAAVNLAAKAQCAATIGSWITFGITVVTLGVSILGAMGGVPSLRHWRPPGRWSTPMIEARG